MNFNHLSHFDVVLWCFFLSSISKRKNNSNWKYFLLRTKIKSYINLNLTVPNKIYKNMILSTPALGSRSKILDLMRIITIPCKEVWKARCARFYSVKALWDLCNLDVVASSSCKEAMGCQEIYHFALNCWNTMYLC